MTSFLAVLIDTPVVLSGWDRESWSVISAGAPGLSEVPAWSLSAVIPLFLATVLGSQLRRRRQKDQQEQPDRSESFFQALIENALEIVTVTDREGTILYESPGNERILGYVPEETVGRSVFEFIHPDDQSRVRRIFEEGIREPGATRSLEFRTRHKDGSWRIIEAIGRNLLDDPDVAAVIIQSRDVTDWCEAEDALRQVHDELARRIQGLRETNEDLQRKNEELEQFVYTVSHDLKSPLVTILGFIGLLKEDMEGDLDDGPLDSFRRIERAAERMHQTIDELLQLSRIGRFRNPPETVDVGSLLDDLRRELQESFAEYNAEIDIQADLPRVVADRQRLRQAFENLLTNALQYGCRGPEPKITVGSVTDDGEIRYYVRDNGPGICADYHERIFGLFQRLDTRCEGTGVGLALVAKILRIHGGRTWVESAPDRGATFWLAFPAQTRAIVQDLTGPH